MIRERDPRHPKRKGGLSGKEGGGKEKQKKTQYYKKGKGEEETCVLDDVLTFIAAHPTKWAQTHAVLAS
jgi:hypothetical protein